jgi:hypothetical protein
METTPLVDICPKVEDQKSQKRYVAVVDSKTLLQHKRGIETVILSVRDEQTSLIVIFYVCLFSDKTIQRS